MKRNLALHSINVFTFRRCIPLMFISVIKSHRSLVGHSTTGTTDAAAVLVHSKDTLAVEPRIRGSCSA